jgi:hypothetical protein
MHALVTWILMHLIYLTLLESQFNPEPNQHSATNPVNELDNFWSGPDPQRCNASKISDWGFNQKGQNRETKTENHQQKSRVFYIGRNKLWEKCKVKNSDFWIRYIRK